MNQQSPACEIIYSDDGSGDGSAELVEREFPQVTVLRQDWQGVAVARNRAAAMARGDWLLFLDGDDILPPNYTGSRLAVAAKHPEASIVYGPAQAFGTADHLWQAPDYEPAKLWVRTYINSTSLVRRDHFEAAGCWRECLSTGWDWDLWLRMHQAGYSAVCDPDSILQYRQHPASVSHDNDLKSERWELLGPLFYFIRSLNARNRIVSIVSGRLLELFPAWMERVAENIRQFRQQWHADMDRRHTFRGHRMPDPAVNLSLYCTGPAAMMATIYREVERYRESFGEVELIHKPWQSVHTTEQQRRDNVCRFLAATYNRLLRDEVWWSIEDDVIPPPDAMTELHRALLWQSIPRYAVAGWYRSRHHPEQIIAHQWRAGRASVETEPPTEPTGYDLTGTGCLMAFRPLASHGFSSHVGRVQAHDWAWCLGLRQYRQPWHPGERAVVVLPGVACQHYCTAGEWV